MNTALSRYLADMEWPAARQRRMVDGLRLLQDIARTDDRPVTYAEFARAVQPGLAPIAASRVLADIGQFCDARWPAEHHLLRRLRQDGGVLGRLSVDRHGRTRVAREPSWLNYGVRQEGPLVDAVPPVT
jgi:hypothetical protein